MSALAHIKAFPPFPICAEPGLAWIVTMLIGGITSTALEAERWEIVGSKQGADLSLLQRDLSVKTRNEKMIEGGVGAV